MKTSKPIDSKTYTIKYSRSQPGCCVKPCPCRIVPHMNNIYDSKPLIIVIRIW